ncbi:TatD family hydrolase [Kaarinaea lacus]
MNLIDTHCHIDVDAFDRDREDVLTRSHQAGVSHLLVPGITANSWSRLKEICSHLPGLYPAYGLHPVYLDSHSNDDVASLETWLQKEKPIAVGEIGLDYFYKQDGVTELDRDRQQELFEAQLTLAEKYSLPVIMHVRKSHDAVLSTLRRYDINGGTCHAFNGSMQQAQQYLDMGFKLGFGGMLTYERSHKLHRLARQLPLEAIVLETDAPDMSGAEHHGQRNSPEYLPEVLDILATLRNENKDHIAEQTTRNAESVFQLC